MSAFDMIGSSERCSCREEFNASFNNSGPAVSTVHCAKHDEKGE